MPNGEDNYIVGRLRVLHPVGVGLKDFFTNWAYETTRQHVLLLVFSKLTSGVEHIAAHLQKLITILAFIR